MFLLSEKGSCPSLSQMKLSVLRKTTIYSLPLGYCFFIGAAVGIAGCHEVSIMVCAWHAHDLRRSVRALRFISSLCCFAWTHFSLWGKAASLASWCVAYARHCFQLFCPPSEEVPSFSFIASLCVCLSLKVRFDCIHRLFISFLSSSHQIIQKRCFWRLKIHLKWAVSVIKGMGGMLSCILSTHFSSVFSRNRPNELQLLNGPLCF